MPTIEIEKEPGDRGQKKETKEITVRCPHCNYEYMLADIILPQYFLGKAQVIERDYLGNIINKIGYKEPIHRWRYNCDQCYRDFDIRVAPSISAVIIPWHEANKNSEWTVTKL